MKRNILIILFLLVILSSGVFALSIKEVEGNITQAVRSYLIEKEEVLADSEIKVQYKYTWKIFNNLSKKKGDIKFEVAELYPGFMPLGNVIIPIQVIVNEEPKEKVFLRSKVMINNNVVVANRSLRKNTVIDEDDVSLTKRDIARAYNKNYFASTEEVIGKEVKAYIPRNYIVIDWMIKERSLVRKKDKVKIKATAGEVEVSADGIILEDGGKGAKVKVKNSASGKVIIGRVISSDEVRVEKL